MTLCAIVIQTAMPRLLLQTASSDCNANIAIMMQVMQILQQQKLLQGAGGPDDLAATLQSSPGLVKSLLHSQTTGTSSTTALKGLLAAVQAACKCHLARTLQALAWLHTWHQLSFPYGCCRCTYVMNVSPKLKK